MPVKVYKIGVCNMSVVFREKNFVAPLIAAAGGPLMLGLMGGGTAISAAQGHKANKAAQKASEQQTEELRRQTALMAKQTQAYEKAAKDAANNGSLVQSPAMMQQTTYSITLKRKTFGVAGSIAKVVKSAAEKAAGSGAWKRFKGSKFGKNATGFAKDLYEVGKERGSGQKMADMFAAGSLMAGGTYLVDKAIQADKKKLGIETPEAPKEKKSGFKKAMGILGTAGTVAAGTAGTLVLARKGKLNRDTFKKAGNVLKTGYKNSIIPAKDPKTGKMAKGAWVAPAMTVIFPATSGISYMTQRQQLKDQAQQSGEQERQYSKVPFKLKLRNGTRKVIDAPASFFGFGEKNRQQLSQQLKNTTSGSTWTETASKLVNPKHIVPGAAVGLGLGTLAFKPFDMGDKAVRKPLEKVDKKAYGHEKSQNQVV